MKFTTAVAAAAATSAVMASTVVGAPMAPRPSMMRAPHSGMMATRSLPRTAMAYPGPTRAARDSGSLAAVTRQEEGDSGPPAGEGEDGPAWEGEGGPSEEWEAASNGEGEAAGPGDKDDGPAPQGRYFGWGYGGYGYGYPGYGYGYGFGRFGYGFPGYGFGYGWY
ncbi:hypothetical protein MMPV_000093 [Pyropia vietnamensis]